MLKFGLWIAAIGIAMLVYGVVFGDVGYAPESPEVRNLFRWLDISVSLLVVGILSSLIAGVRRIRNNRRNSLKS
jgi:hypothetical protein